MRIKVIVPITTKEFEEETRREVETLVSPGTEVDTEAIRYGTASIESLYDELLCAPNILRLAEQAEEQGFEGIFISCMGDPGVDAARERVRIPVVGPARASMLYAADLAHRFSIVTVLENVVPLLENLALQYGLAGKLASVRSIDIPVLCLCDKEKLVAALTEESVKAIKGDGAHAIILGCTGMIGVDAALATSLAAAGYDVPVVYPVAVSLRYLETLVALRLSHSRKTYMSPPPKARNLFERLGL